VGRPVVGAGVVVVSAVRSGVVVGCGAEVLLVEAVQVQMHPLLGGRGPAGARGARRVADLVVGAAVAAAPVQLVLEGAGDAEDEEDDADGQPLGGHHHQHPQKGGHHAQLVHDRQQGHLQTPLEEGAT